MIFGYNIQTLLNTRLSTCIVVYKGRCVSRVDEKRYSCISLKKHREVESFVAGRETKSVSNFRLIRITEKNLVFTSNFSIII